MVTVKIEGLDELERALETLPPKAARSIIGSGLRQAAGIWRNEMKSTVRRGWHKWKAVILGRKGGGGERQGFSGVREFGVISRLIGMKTTISSDGLAGTCIVGPDKKAFWAQFMEYGTAHEAPVPFVRPAFESKKDAVVQKFEEVVRQKLEDAGIL